MDETSLKDVLMPMVDRTIDRVVDAHTQKTQKNFDLETIVEFARTALVSDKDIHQADVEGMSAKEIKDYLKQLADQMYIEKEKALYDPAQILEFEKVVILRVVDQHWTDHIDAMDQLRQSVGLRGYGQLNPLVEYQQEGYRMFNEMITDIEYETTRLFMKSEIRQNLQR